MNNCNSNTSYYRNLSEKDKYWANSFSTTANVRLYRIKVVLWALSLKNVMCAVVSQPQLWPSVSGRRSVDSGTEHWAAWPSINNPQAQYIKGRHDNHHSVTVVKVCQSPHCVDCHSAPIVTSLGQGITTASLTECGDHVLLLQTATIDFCLHRRKTFAAAERRTGLQHSTVPHHFFSSNTEMYPQ